MQHGHILKKFNFGLGPTPKTTPGALNQAFKLKFRLICFISIAALPACKISAKNIILTIVLVIVKFKYLTLGYNFDTAMLIYRHWAIMVFSEKLLNIIDLMKCEDYHTKKLIYVLHYNCSY